MAKTQTGKATPAAQTSVPAAAPVQLPRKSVRALGANPAITAEIIYTGPTVLATGSTVSLTGFSSADCPVSVARYNWTFGDGTSFSSQSVTSVSHTFTSQGVYSVTLSVTPGGVRTPDCTNAVVAATHQEHRMTELLAGFGLPVISGSAAVPCRPDDHK